MIIAPGAGHRFHVFISGEGATQVGQVVRLGSTPLTMMLGVILLIDIETFVVSLVAEAARRAARSTHLLLGCPASCTLGPGPGAAGPRQARWRWPAARDLLPEQARPQRPALALRITFSTSPALVSSAAAPAPSSSAINLHPERPSRANDPTARAPIRPHFSRHRAPAARFAAAVGSYNIVAMSLPLLAALVIACARARLPLLRRFSRGSTRSTTQRDHARGGTSRRRRLRADPAVLPVRPALLGDRGGRADRRADPRLPAVRLAAVPPLDRARRRLHRRGARLLDARRVGAPRRPRRSPRSCASTSAPGAGSR